MNLKIEMIDKTIKELKTRKIGLVISIIIGMIFIITSIVTSTFILFGTMGIIISLIGVLGSIRISKQTNEWLLIRTELLSKKD